MSRVAFWRAWSIWAVSLALTATTITATVLRPLPARLVNFSGSGLNGAVSIVFIGAFATVGALLAWKRPANPIGWLLSAIGLESAVAVFSVFLAHFPRTLTLATWLGFLYLLGFGLCAVVVLLFPTGKLPSRRWRPVAWAAWTGLAGWVAGLRVRSHDRHGQPGDAEPGRCDRAAGEIFKLLAGGGAVLIIAAGLAAVLSLVFRYRRAQAAERAQLRWLVYAGALIVAAVVATILIGSIMGPGDASTNLQNALSSGAVALVPVAIGIAVMRYRLYDIDRIISRTVAYAIVTGLLVGAYAGPVLLATQVLRLHTPVAVAAATLTAAALFNPVRRRVQSRVDRQFNRARYDADQIAAAFAARLKDTVDLGSVRDDLTGIVSRALEPAHVSVWISRPQDRS